MTNQKESHSTRLYRSETDRVIGGVAGGLGDFFNVDPSIVRLIFILLTFFGGSGLPIYIILWIVVPSQKTKGNLGSEQNIKDNVNDIKTSAKKFAYSIKSGNSKEDSKFIWGLLLVIVGILFLFNNFGLYLVNFERFWPLVLVGLGLMIVLK